MIARRALPDEDHIARFVPYSKQDRDPETDEFRGLSVAACKLRPDDDGGLSVNWIEKFGDYGTDAKRAAAIAFRETRTDKKLPPKAVFGYAKITEVKAAAQRFNKSVRVIWDPVPGNDGHALVRHFTDEDIQLLDLMSTDVFGDFDIVGEMDLPQA